MDIRTASQLCLVDLIPLIAAGDFRCFGAAQGIVEAALSSAPDDRYRGALLGRLAEELAGLDATPPECDALLRGIRACMRRQLEVAFSGRL